MKNFTAHELNECLIVETQSNAGLHPIWTAEWANISGIKSKLGDFCLSDEFWELDASLFEGRAAVASRPMERTVDFTRLDNSSYDDVESVKRRLKRLMWIGLHTTPNSANWFKQKANFVIRLVKELEPLILIKTHLAGDTCPDGPQLFTNLIQSQYEEFFDESFVPRDAYHLLSEIAPYVDDKFDFLPATYSDYANSKAKEGGYKDKVKDGAYSDLESSEILKQSMYLSSLLLIAVAYEDWAQPHIKEAERRHADGETKFGMFRYAESKDSIVLSTTEPWASKFVEEFVKPNEARFIEEGLLTEEGRFKYVIGSGRQAATSLNDFGERTKNNLVTLIELSHRITIAYFTGMRPQELHALPFDALEKRLDESFTRVVGYDLKTDDSIGGAERDWPIPDECAVHIKRQQILSERFFGQTQELFNLKRGLHSLLNSSFVPQTSLEDGHNIVKKQRPTVAAHVMLASRSPMAGMTVLGHEAVEQHMGYAKSREDLSSEILAQDELVNRVLGRRILDNVSTGKAPQKIQRKVLESTARFAGLDSAADKIRDMVNHLNIDDFTEVLDFVGDNAETVEEHLGKHFDFVNPFTLCAGRKGDFKGACSASAGVKNPSNCQSSCQYRYELFENLDFREKQVEFALEDIADFEPDEPNYYHRVNVILDCIYGFEGPLSKYKTDLRIQTLLTGLKDSPDGVAIVRKLKPTAKQAFKEIMGELA